MKASVDMLKGQGSALERKDNSNYCRTAGVIVKFIKFLKVLRLGTSCCFNVTFVMSSLAFTPGRGAKEPTTAAA